MLVEWQEGYHPVKNQHSSPKMLDNLNKNPKQHFHFHFLVQLYSLMAQISFSFVIPLIHFYSSLATFLRGVHENNVYIEDRRPTDRPTSHFGKLRTAISRQRVIRCTSCLVPCRVFDDGGSNGPTSGWTKSKIAAGMSYPIHFHELQSSFGGIQEKIMCEE